MTCRPDARTARVLAAGVLAALLAFHPAFGKSGPALDEARDALRRGDGIAAEAILRDALNRGASANGVAALMGEAELMQEDLPAARRWLEPGDFAPSERAHGYHMLGRLEMASGDFPAAGAAFDKTLAISPDDPVLWVDIGRLRYRGGEHLQAIEAADHALALAPDSPAALIFRGQLTRDSIGPVASLPLFARAVLSAPDDLMALYEYAATLGEIGRAKTMLVVTRRMIEIDPTDPRAFYLQAVLAARAGKDELARRLLWRTDETYRRVPAALMLQGVLELRSGNSASALEAFETLWRMQPDNELAAQLVSRALAVQGRQPKSMASPPALPIEVLAARWQHAPGDPARFMPYVRQLVARQDHAAALAVTGQLVRRFPGSGDVHYLAGDVERAAGHHDRALAHYRVAARVRTSPALLDRMMAAERNLGHPERADAMLREYAAQHPMAPIAREARKKKG